MFLILRPPSSGFHPVRLMGQLLHINPKGSNASKPRPCCTLGVLAELSCSSAVPHPSLTPVQNKNSARVWGTPHRWVTPARPQPLLIHGVSGDAVSAKPHQTATAAYPSRGLGKCFTHRAALAAVYSLSSAFHLAG